MTYRIFLFSNVLVTFVILLSICNIKIYVSIVFFLNESECIVLRVIAFVLIDISVTLVMSSFLFLVNSINSNSTSILVSLSITFYCSVTSSSSVPLSSKSSLDSFSKENESFKILDYYYLK